jgi:hypothetical protein
MHNVSDRKSCEFDVVFGLGMIDDVRWLAAPNSRLRDIDVFFIRLHNVTSRNSENFDE